MENRNLFQIIHSIVVQVHLTNTVILCFTSFMPSPVLINYHNVTIDLDNFDSPRFSKFIQNVPCFFWNNTEGQTYSTRLSLYLESPCLHKDNGDKFLRVAVKGIFQRTKSELLPACVKCGFKVVLMSKISAVLICLSKQGTCDTAWLQTTLPNFALHNVWASPHILVICCISLVRCILVPPTGASIY